MTKTRIRGIMGLWEFREGRKKSAPEPGVREAFPEEVTSMLSLRMNIQMLSRILPAEGTAPAKA